MLLALIVLYSVPWLYRPEIDFNPQTVADAQAYELDSRQITLSSYGEYLPAQTQESALNPLGFQAESSRLQENGNFSILSLDESNRGLSAELDVSETTMLVAEWLYVPGWRARVDGKAVKVMPAGDAGFVSFELPEGQHRIEIRYGGTGTQQLAMVLSSVATVLAILVAIFPLNPSPQNVRERDLPDEADSVSTEMTLSTILTVAIVGLLLFGLKTQWIDNSDTIFRNPRFENGIIEDVATPLNINFNNDIHLIGAEIDNNIASGETATIHLYWTLSGDPIERDYSTIVQLVDSQGIVIAETSNFYPGGLATRNWLPGYYVEDVIIAGHPAIYPAEKL